MMVVVAAAKDGRSNRKGDLHTCKIMPKKQLALAKQGSAWVPRARSDAFRPPR
jgi:hypothetical protein